MPTFIGVPPVRNLNHRDTEAQRRPTQRRQERQQTGSSRAFSFSLSSRSFLLCASVSLWLASSGLYTLSPSVEVPRFVAGAFWPHFQPLISGWSSPCLSM